MVKRFFKTDPWPRDKKMTFGKHKGTPVCEVPASYLLWLYYTDWLEDSYQGLYEYIKRRLGALRAAQRKEPRRPRPDDFTDQDHIDALDGLFYDCDWW